MSQEAMEQLMSRWTNDPTFQEQLRSDPEGAIRSTGLVFDESEWEALRNMDWSLPDVQLQDRISKQGGLFP
jgi:hypothetical protein